MPKGANMLMLDQTVGQYIDADYYHKKMGAPKPDKKDALLDQWENKDYKKLVDTVKQLNDPAMTDIVFFLMTIPHTIVDAIMRQIKKTNEEAAKGGTKLHDFSAPITNDEQPWGGITYMTGQNGREVVSKLHVISSMNKYRATAGVWLALGADNNGNIGCIAFSNSPWVQTKDMDEALELYSKNTKGHVEKIDYGKPSK
jgi:hypothetical protein